MSEDPVIDVRALDNLRALDPENGDAFVREIVGVFTTDTPERFGELNRSRSDGDVETFIRSAHSLKGSSANLGALRFRRAAETLEHHARKEGLTGVDPLLEALQSEFETAIAELRRLTSQE